MRRGWGHALPCSRGGCSCHSGTKTANSVSTDGARSAQRSQRGWQANLQPWTPRSAPRSDSGLGGGQLWASGVDWGRAIAQGGALGWGRRGGMESGGKRGLGTSLTRSAWGWEPSNRHPPPPLRYLVGRAPSTPQPPEPHANRVTNQHPGVGNHNLSQRRGGGARQRAKGPESHLLSPRSGVPQTRCLRSLRCTP